MNDKTEQSLADALRCTAAGGRAEIINVPGYPLMVRAVDYNALRSQLAEAQRDAERYRWMRDKETSEGWDIIGRSGTPAAIDAAIDTAKGESNGSD